MSAAANLPKRGQTHRADRAGVAAVLTAVLEDLGWEFREQSVADYGIDAHIEVVTPDDDVTGRLIGVQIKSGPSHFGRGKPGKGEMTFRGKGIHLNYWLGHSLPVIVVLYHPDRRTCYWQVIDETTARPTGKSFLVAIPETNVLDANAREPLEHIARRTGQPAREAFDRFLDRLPNDVCRGLRLAAEQDPLSAAMMAQMLADGVVNPPMIAAQILAAEPTWLLNSPAQAQLWAAAGAFALSHGHAAVAASLLLRAADVGGRQAARRRALAGMAMLEAEQRERARPVLEEARKAGAVLLSDCGLAYLEIAPGDARAVPAPASVLNATEQELLEEPAALAFLAELRIREGDLDEAVRLLELGVATPGREALQLRLADALKRRRTVRRGGAGAADGAAALRHARAALQEMRRWAGPSHKALAELLDLELLTGSAQQVIAEALPAVAGGNALDCEAAAPAIATRGAAAATVTENKTALEHFRGLLAGHPRLAFVDAHVTEADTSDPATRRTAWHAALAAADDDQIRAACALKLADLGVWPIPALDGLRARSVIPDLPYQLAALRAQAVTRDAAAVLPELRVLAAREVTAVADLIRLVAKEHGTEHAWKEWHRQQRQWQDPMLIEMLPRMLELPGSAEIDDQVISDWLADPRLSADVRSEVRRSVVTHLADRRDWPRVARLCHAGLAQGQNDALIWPLLAALYYQRNVPEARRILTSYRPTPVNQVQVRLWGQLHVGDDLTPADAAIAADLAEQYAHVPALAAAFAALLTRELRRVERDQVPWPSEFVDRVRHVVDTITAAGHGPQQVSDEELRRRLEDAQDEQLRVAQSQVLRKDMPLATFASMARRPYGQLLLQRSLGAVIAADDHSALRAAGAEAAAAALAAGGGVADLSALHLLQLLGRDGQLLRHRLPDLRTTTSTVDDAIRSRDAIWVSVGASHLVRLEGGVVKREEVSATGRALLRRRAAELEDIAAALPHDPVPAGSNPGDDVITLAEGEGLAMYSDDCALRAQARARGVPAFGTTDLIAAAGLSAEKAAEVIMTLAAEYVVDLPLTGEQAAALQAATGWADGPGLLQLNRQQWAAARRPDLCLAYRCPRCSCRGAAGTRQRDPRSPGWGPRAVRSGPDATAVPTGGGHRAARCARGWQRGTGRLPGPVG